MKKNKLFKRILAFALVLSMVFSAVTPVHAANTTSTDIASPSPIDGEDIIPVAGNQGIRFGLYDYSIDINKNSDGSFTELSKYFMFRASGENGVDYGPLDPNYDGQHFGLDHSTVERNLNNGYPVLDFSRRADGSAKAEATKSDGNVFSQSERSLGFLFGAEHPEVTTYPVNNTLLQYIDGHYIYNAKTNAADYEPTSDTFILRNYPERGYPAAGVADKGSHADLNDLFPFNTLNGNTATKNHPNGHPYHYDTEDINYWFGMTMETDFLQPKNGITDQNEPMIFQFSGDDDVWVFVDGMLVLDIGGAHPRVSGSIDFKTGLVEAYLNSFAGTKDDAYWSTTIYESFKAAYEEHGLSADEVAAKLADTFEATGTTVTDYKGKTYDGYRLKDYSTHQMKMFYMERCSGAANCLIDFNLQTIPDNAVTVEKKVEGLNENILKDQSYKMRLMVKEVNEDEFSPWNDTTKSTVEVDQNGFFYLKDGEKAEFVVPDGSEYYVEEHGVADYNVSFKYNNDNAKSVNVTEGIAVSEVYGMAADTNNVLVTNSAKPYKVEISKVFKGANLDGAVPEGFDATFSLYKYDMQAGAKVGDAVETVKYTDFVNGKYTFEGLLPGTYFIEESEVVFNEELNLVFDKVVYSSNPITLNTDKITVNVENNYQFKTKQLIIDKTVSGDGKDPEAAFDFSLVVKDEAGQIYTGNLPVKDKDDLVSANGKYAFTLKDGEIINITIPYGYTYEVTEADYHDDGYITTVTQEANAEAATPETVDCGNPASGTLTTDAKVHFTNTLRTPVSVELNALKYLDTDFASQGFTFVLKDKATNGEVYSQEVQNSSDGTIKFDALTFNKKGTYEYVLYEVENTEDDAVIYDKAIYNIKVEVTIPNAGTAYTADVTFTKGEASDSVQDLVFVNKKRIPATVELKAVKTLDTKTPTDGIFRFELSGDGLKDPQVRTTKDGVVTFDLSSVTFDKVGEYNYRITEVIGDDKDIIYDKTAYDVVVKVTAPKDEERYVAKVIYDSENPELEEAVFANKTRDHVKLALAANKTMDGEKPEADQFEFVLSEYDENGVAVERETVKNQADGSIQFGEFTYETEGVHKYLITEKAGDDENVVYDHHAYIATVTVTAPEGDGAYETAVSYQKVDTLTGATEDVKDVMFENASRAAAVVELHATKTLNDKAPKAGRFEFELKDAEGNVIETVSNDGKGEITFGALEFAESGTYNYTISEINTEEKNIIYDESVYDVEVNVSVGSAYDEAFTADVTISEDGESVDEISFENEKVKKVFNVKTGDGAAPVIWGLTGLLSLLVIAMLEMLKRRKFF